jgi:hypothetical protein
MHIFNQLNLAPKYHDISSMIHEFNINLICMQNKQITNKQKYEKNTTISMNGRKNRAF